MSQSSLGVNTGIGVEKREQWKLSWTFGVLTQASPRTQNMNQNEHGPVPVPVRPYDRYHVLYCTVRIILYGTLCTCSSYRPVHVTTCTTGISTVRLYCIWQLRSCSTYLCRTAKTPTRKTHLRYRHTTANCSCVVYQFFTMAVAVRSVGVHLPWTLKHTGTVGESCGLSTVESKRTAKRKKFGDVGIESYQQWRQ